MMRSMKLNLITWFLLSLWSLFVLLVNSHSALIFVFGDSVYEPGNNVFFNTTINNCNLPPYGETFFKFPTGRCCDGRIIPDFIAMNAKLPLWRPYLEPGRHQYKSGANFASGGAGVLSQTNPGTISLGLQVSFLKKVALQWKQELGQEEAKTKLNKAIYLSSIGGDDYSTFLGRYPNLTESQEDEFVKMVIGNLTNAIREIYKIGGRKFAFQNVGPMGCMPLLKLIYGLGADECYEELNAFIRLHNQALVELCEELKNQLDGFEYSIFDFYTTLYNIIKNPTKYGLLVSDVSCCGVGTYRAIDCGLDDYELCSNPNKYVFFDSAHATEFVNVQLAQLFWNGTPPITGPLNIKQLFKLNAGEATTLIKQQVSYFAQHVLKML